MATSGDGGVIIVPGLQAPNSVVTGEQLSLGTAAATTENPKVFGKLFLKYLCLNSKMNQHYFHFVLAISPLFIINHVTDTIADQTSNSGFKLHYTQVSRILLSIIVIY